LGASAPSAPVSGRQRLIINEAALLEFVAIAQKLGIGLLTSYQQPGLRTST
jgi:hypothetical protein